MSIQIHYDKSSAYNNPLSIAAPLFVVVSYVNQKMLRPMKSSPPPIPALSNDSAIIDTHCHLDMDAYSRDLDSNNREQ